MGAAEPAPPQSRGSRRTWKVLGILVTIGSVVWMLVLLARAWPMLLARIGELDVVSLGAGTVLLTVSVYLNFEAFATLAGAMGIAGASRLQLAHLYFIGQLLKHVPGRIWGVGYQSAAGSASGSAGAWLAANVVHMLLATMFALWSVAIVLAALQGLLPGLCAMVVGAVACLGCWRFASSLRLRRVVLKLPGRLGGPLHESMSAMASTSARARMRITLSYAASLVLLYLAWGVFGHAYPLLGAVAGVRLCGIYLVAWFVGFVSLLTPSGLGVRELVFAWLAHGYGMDAVALMAVIGRVTLLISDLALGLLFAPFLPGGGKR